MASRGRVILIDDEPDLAAAFAEYLTARGFDAVAGEGAFAFEAFAKAGMPDIVVTDLSMPGEDGRQLLRRIRALGDVPVIVMTASPQLLDRILCLELGADDFIQKPVAPRELLARIEGLISRRSGRRRDTARFESSTVDFRASLVMRDDGTEEKLGAGELALLRAFLERPHCVLSRDDILGLAPGQDRDALGRSIDPRIARLKRKLATEWIKLSRGQGYIYAPPE